MIAMNRLTERDEFGNADIIALSDVMPEIYGGLLFAQANALTAAMNRLAAYEDTGFTPDEIIAMKADKERRDKLIEENDALLWDKRFDFCPNCGGNHIRTHSKRTKSKYQHNTYYFGRCADCGYRGNAAHLPSEALKAWNDGARGINK
ncbi:MAG: hypothetical protein NC299_08995 [Lachnospiraceae bacterium]|nr:hypothetical protein [Lachnospiraceae bacterium]